MRGSWKYRLLHPKTHPRRHLGSAVVASLLLAGGAVRAGTFHIANGDIAGLKSVINTCNGNNQDVVINLAVGGT